MHLKRLNSATHSEPLRSESALCGTPMMTASRPQPLVLEALLHLGRQNEAETTPSPAELLLWL